MRFTFKRLGLGSILAAAVLAIGLGWGAAAKAATQVRVVLSYYSAKTGPVFEAIAKEFKEKNPDIDIKIEVVTWATLFQKLTTDIAGGRPPDISIIATRWLADFAAQGIAEPLDGHMSPAFKDKFIATFFTPSIIEGKIYGLPVAASVRALYYNKELLAKAGLEGPPKTWEELRATAKKVSALGQRAYGFGVQGNLTETDAYWYYALWNFGGELFREGKSAIAGPEGVSAAKFYKRMIDEGLTQPGVTGYARADLENLFKQGRLAMVLTGPWLRGQMKREAPNVEYGVAEIPRAATKATYGVTDSIIMFRSSKVKKAAWKFLEATFQSKWRSRFNRNEGMLPVLKSVAAEPHFKDDEELAAFIAMLPFAKFAPPVPNWEEMADIILRALQQIYIGDASAEEALGQAAARVDKMLKR